MAYQETASAEVGVPPRSPTAIEQIREKLKRADEHIAYLNRELETFLNQAPERRLVNYSPEEAEAFKRLHEQRIVDPRFSVITGEVLHQMRSSLDYLVAALVVRDGGTVTTQTGFPIFTRRPNRDHRRHPASYHRKIEGIKRKRVLAAINREQPYKGRNPQNHPLAVLCELSNRDKHSSLVLHVVAVFPTIYVETRGTRGSDMMYFGRDDGTQPTASYVAPSGEFIQIVHMHRRVATNVAFDKWGDSRGDMPLIRGLEALLSVVTYIVDSLEPYLQPRTRKRPVTPGHR